MVVDDPYAKGAALAAGGGRSARLALRKPMIGERFESVLAGARTGAEWAWTDLYQNFAPAVLGYLRAQRVPEPEDLTAEVFFQLVKSLGQFEGNESDFRSWIFVIAHRKIIDDSRARKRRPAEPVPNETIESRSPAGNVEDEALEQLSELYFRRLMVELTADQKDVMLLRILGGLTVPEVAAAMGKRAGAVEALQRRAVAQLRKRINYT
ncbi:MAG: sigma-70 family RNA polymerase sigma factor [Actinomycetota bacterium]